MVDPLLKREFPVTRLNQAVGVAAMCLQDEPLVRPLISDVVAALSFLAVSPPDAPVPARLVPLLSSQDGDISAPEKEDSSDSVDDEKMKDKGNKSQRKKKMKKQDSSSSSTSSSSSSIGS
ncbi:unnamed protein product [Fraxinus pennsylvanica]|uniref:Uncharacterized protein n=1 Tax=Fraxinus pennsylvanica TaxID=56036 RepID=A0AAD1YTH2_9LAMI|nr:unnamed protein product [Fraxinus pennsylvanica]